MKAAIEAYTLTCALGPGLAALRAGLWGDKEGLRPNDLAHSSLPTHIGRVSEADDFRWPDDQRAFVSRNNALCAIALVEDGFSGHVKSAIERVGSDRVGVIIGTSTAGIDRTESGYRAGDGDSMPPDFRQPQVHTPHAPTRFVATRLGIDGPQMTISTACSSSAKVFASAQRWMAAGLVDAVVVGGADALCLSVLHGFASLELVSTQPCRPFDRNRDGINIGEAAGFALLVRDHESATLRLAGSGESSDAYHMSHPHPEGAGALASMRQAISRADITPQDVGYINLHGTASKANDAIETAAVAALFEPDQTLASSTKGWTGHALGAAGIAEAVITMEALRAQRVPGTRNLINADPGCVYPIARSAHEKPMTHAMTNSFGFGGNNASLVFEATVP